MGGKPAKPLSLAELKEYIRITEDYTKYDLPEDAIDRLFETIRLAWAQQDQLVAQMAATIAAPMLPGLLDEIRRTPDKGAAEQQAKETKAAVASMSVAIARAIIAEAERAKPKEPA